MTTGRRKSIVFFIFTLCHAGILVLASEADFVKSVINYGRYETDDAVIIEAPSEETIRQKRHLFRQFEGLLLATGPCFTSKGILGQCTPFRQCYPYFKLPELNNWDTWILGLYDTCTYFTPQGRQMFGVCCSNPVTPVTENPISNPPVIAGTDEDTKKEPANEIGEKPSTVTQSHQAVPPNWPPPIPTHGPDNTIPPLPTHPPSPGFPVQTVPPTSPTVGAPTTTKPQSTTWPSKPGKPPQPPVPPQWPPQVPTHPPTPAPPQWPPTQAPPQWPPTHPPTQAPATEAPGGGGFDGQCGTKEQDRIVGGQNAGVGEWPWIAALFNGGRQFCGGSLIDNIHILSAAHCVAHMSSWDVARLTVRLGDHNIKTNNEIAHVEKRVKRVVRHKGFDGRTLYNDVAILTLDSPVTFSRIIRPICLPSGAGSYAGRPATVIGWGSLRESGPQPAVLQKVNIVVWTNGECRQKYGNAAPGGIVEHMLCAGEANKDSCSGDSGGPLMVNEGRWTQVGIVSWGIGCGKGQYPGVYTRVTYFLPWIEKNRK